MADQNIKPAGFPDCPVCPYLERGALSVCTSCAHETLRHPTGPVCEVCAQELSPGSRCTNNLCNDPDRKIDRIEAIAVYSDPLDKKIVRLKKGKIGWARIFGRLVLGYLEMQSTSAAYTAIIANPTYTEPNNVKLGHTELVLESAATEDVGKLYHFKTRGLYLSESKPKRDNSFAAKKVAAQDIKKLLQIDTSLHVAGGNFLIYDDVCTTGFQLDAIAHRLKDEGAVSVTGLVLARTPWRL